LELPYINEIREHWKNNIEFYVKYEILRIIDINLNSDFWNDLVDLVHVSGKTLSVFFSII